MMKCIKFFLLFSFVFLMVSCSQDKIPLPNVPKGEELFGNVGKEVYNLINPILDAEHGYNFNQPADIYRGADNFLYICDTGNNRIVMMDIGGVIQGVSQPIDHPVAISQNDSLELLVVNKTNRVYKIDLLSVNHSINQAPVELVYEQTSEPTRQFTGITVHNGFEYYVSVIDVADSSTNFKEFSFIYDFDKNHILKGPLPLFVNGTGLFSTILPTSVLSLRERYLDVSAQSEDTPAFMFTHIGRTSLLQNTFKYQHVTTRIVEGSVMLTPNTALIGSDIYEPNKFWRLQDVTIDRQGFVLLVDAGRSINSDDTTRALPGFYRFAPSGKQLQSVLGLGNDPREFNNPKGIAITPFLEQQIVYISDTGNDRVMMFQLSTQ